MPRLSEKKQMRIFLERGLSHNGRVTIALMLLNRLNDFKKSGDFDNEHKAWFYFEKFCRDFNIDISEYVK